MTINLSRIQVIFRWLKLLFANKSDDFAQTQNKFSLKPGCLILLLRLISQFRTYRRVRKNCEKRLSASSYLPVCPSVRTEQLGSHWVDFHEILYLRLFRKYVKKIEVLLKYEKNNGTLQKHQYKLIIISRSFILRKRNISDKCCRKLKTHILGSMTFCRKLCGF
jgi:hypothetical protein